MKPSIQGLTDWQSTKGPFIKGFIAANYNMHSINLPIILNSIHTYKKTTKWTTHVSFFSFIMLNAILSRINYDFVTQNWFEAEKKEIANTCLKWDPALLLKKNKILKIDSRVRGRFFNNLSYSFKDQLLTFTNHYVSMNSSQLGQVKYVQLQ